MNKGMNEKGEPILVIWKRIMAQFHEPDWKPQVVKGKGQVSWDSRARFSHPLLAMQIWHAVGIVMQRYTELDHFVCFLQPSRA